MAIAQAPEQMILLFYRGELDTGCHQGRGVSMRCLSLLVSAAEVTLGLSQGMQFRMP